jgi:PKD repeat protein
MKHFSILALFFLLFNLNAKAQCNASYTSTNSGPTFTFTNTSTGGGPGTTYVWTFGDGGNSTSTNATHTYTANGVYTVCLYQYTLAGCVDSACSVITVTGANTGSGGCTASITGIDSFCTGYFANNSTTGYTSTTWYWGDGSSTSSVAPFLSHSYTASGIYTVTAVVIWVNSAGTTCLDSAIMSININCGINPCNASFTSNTSGLTANFTNTSTSSGTAATFSWSFGDGGVSNASNPLHTYAAAGSYTVCLIVNNNSILSPCIDTICQTVTVSGVNTPCNVTLTSTVSGLSTIIVANPSPICAAATYYWSYGDGNVGTNGPTTTHTYSTAGTYTVCLYYSDTCGCVDTVCQTITAVGTGTNTGCTASITGADSLCTGYFVNTSAVGYTSAVWYWGDGSSTNSTALALSHTYTTSGTYNVFAVVSWPNSAGSLCIDTAYFTINISCLPPPCVAFFSTSTTGLTANFSNLSTGGSTGIIYNWTFGDGGSSNAVNPSHTYTAAGVYQVCLVMLSNSSTNPCLDSFCSWVTVTAGGGSNPCNANFTYTTSLCTVTFTSTSTGNFNTGVYSFGNGTYAPISALGNTCTYASNGIYTVCLVIADTNSLCLDTVCQTINLTTCPTSIQTANKLNVSISPNPVSDVLQINSLVNEPVTIDIINMVGHTVITKNLNTIPSSVDVHTLPSGIYIVQVKASNGKQYVQRILKQ